MALLQDLNPREKVTLVVATHSYPLIAEVSSRIIKLFATAASKTRVRRSNAPPSICGAEPMRRRGALGSAGGHLHHHGPADGHPDRARLRPAHRYIDLVALQAGKADIVVTRTGSDLPTAHRPKRPRRLGCRQPAPARSIAALAGDRSGAGARRGTLCGVARNGSDRERELDISGLVPAPSLPVRPVHPRPPWPQAQLRPVHALRALAHDIFRGEPAGRSGARAAAHGSPSRCGLCGGERRDGAAACWGVGEEAHMLAGAFTSHTRITTRATCTRACCGSRRRAPRSPPTWG